MRFSMYNEADLPSATAFEDADMIDALLAEQEIEQGHEIEAENAWLKVAEYHPEDREDDNFLEGAYEDMSDPFGQLD